MVVFEVDQFVQQHVLGHAAGQEGHPPVQADLVRGAARTPAVPEVRHADPARLDAQPGAQLAKLLLGPDVQVLGVPLGEQRPALLGVLLMQPEAAPLEAQRGRDWTLGGRTHQQAVGATGVPEALPGHVLPFAAGRVDRGPFGQLAVQPFLPGRDEPFELPRRDVRGSEDQELPVAFQAEADGLATGALPDGEGQVMPLEVPLGGARERCVQVWGSQR